MLNTIEATMQTEGLLKQSQQLATELQTQQKELQQTNEQLAQKAQQLAEQNVEVERKNQEIEQARRALEEKAKELALTSKYKSEFLANMSHELRTPLNSILVLGQQLSDNPDGNLTPKQVEFARTIHGAGTDLLNLISDILDCRRSNPARCRSRPRKYSSPACWTWWRGRSATRRRTGSLTFRGANPIRTCRAAWSPTPSACSRCSRICCRTRSSSPSRAACACRFPSRRAAGATDHPVLSGAASVVAFEVADTGIGIPAGEAAHHFEAFQQADAGTSRKYGGTGLGLAISRELASLLGGEIQLRSAPGQRQHLHAVPAADLCRPARPRRHGPKRCRRRPRRCNCPAVVIASARSRRSRTIARI